jgi:acid phosphatase (class A)
MRIPSFSLVLLAAALASACTANDMARQPDAALQGSTAPTTNASEVGTVRPGSGILKGYLSAKELPDSLALLPPPPAIASAAQEADNVAFRALSALQGSPRGQLAREDANLQFPQAAAAFSCALGITISEQTTPHLNMLLRRTLADAGLSTYKAKDHYQRTRPFVAFKTASCTPDEDAKLAKDGSYPSGHSAVGWSWALVLAEVAPQRSDALLQRGRAFGQSRGICGVHWQSDIEAGRLIGAATVARLHTHAGFTAQLAAARDEVARMRSQNLPLPRDCLAEATALDSSRTLAP